MPNLQEILERQDKEFEKKFPRLIFTDKEGTPVLDERGAVLDFLSNVRRELILAVAEMMVGEEKPENLEYTEEEKELIRRIFGDDPKYLYIPEHIQERRAGKNERISEEKQKLEEIKKILGWVR